jgi:hypothetical protein
MPGAEELDRLRKLAAEAHEAAEFSRDPNIKRVLLFIAAAYLRLVEFAEGRDNRSDGGS